MTFTLKFLPRCENFPSLLQYLILETKYNELIFRLPSSLKLLFGNCYNRPVDHLLPHLTNLTHLMFGFDFNAKITQWPPCLTHLSFGETFQQSLNNLPDTLTRLELYIAYRYSIQKWPLSISFFS
jgi:hypothetical protein